MVFIAIGFIILLGLQWGKWIAPLMDALGKGIGKTIELGTELVQAVKEGIEESQHKDN